MSDRELGTFKDEYWVGFLIWLLGTAVTAAVALGLGNLIDKNGWSGVVALFNTPLICLLWGAPLWWHWKAERPRLAAALAVPLFTAGLLDGLCFTGMMLQNMVR